MTNDNTYIIIKEFYKAVAPILEYVPCSESMEIEYRILNAIAKAYQLESSIENCWALIEDARHIETVLDGTLLISSKAKYTNAAIDLKLDVLKEQDIKRVKIFNKELFVENVKEKAMEGNVECCKMYAFMNYLGLAVTENHEVALRVWSFLGIYHDFLSIIMLIYAFGVQNDAENTEKWSDVLAILRKSQETFLPIVVKSNAKEEKNDSIRFANMIMLIKTYRKPKEETKIDFPMAQYVLYSVDNYETKMRKISSQTNFFFEMNQEENTKNIKFGF